MSGAPIIFKPRASFAHQGAVLYSLFMSEHDTYAWIEAAQRRGLSGAIRLTLTALAPLGVLGAQLLYIAQPMAAVFGAHRALGDIARALESPDGVQQLLDALEDTEQRN